MGANDYISLSPEFDIISSLAMVNDVTFDPPAGTLAKGAGIKISLSTTTTGAVVIRYTLDGSEPSETSATSFLYNITSKIDLNDQTKTIKAKAFLAGLTPSNTEEATYSFDDKSIIVYQVDESSNIFGHAKLWSSTFSSWRELPTDQGQTTENYDELTFLAFQNFYGTTTQKFNLWKRNNGPTLLNTYYENPYKLDISNQKSGTFVANFKTTYNGIIIQNKADGTSNSFGTIGIKDPWFQDNPSYGGVSGNRETAAIAYSKNSPFQFSAQTTYKGAFLNENSNFYSTLPNYKVIAQPNIGLTINNQTCSAVFASWSAVPSTSAKIEKPGSLETGVVFKTSDAIIQANFHIAKYAESTVAISNNSQRKIARTTEGNLHFVYESMGRVWYELSTDGGTTWQIKNSGKPLDSGEGKNPSIDCYQDAVGIVWQENGLGTSCIKYAAFNSAGEFWVSGVLNDFNMLFSFPPYSVDAKPVIACIGQTKFLVVWENKTQYFPGLVYYYGWITSNGNYIYNVTKLQSGSVPSTSATSINPSIAVNKGFPSGVKHFCLAWEDFNQIRFLKYGMSFNDGSLTQVYAPFTISSGSSYAINKKPSVFAVSDTSARIVWNGVYDDGADYFSVAVFKASDNNQFSNFGDNVNSTNINGSSDITLGSQSAYAVAWAKNNNVIEYTPSSSLNTISTLSNPTNFSGKYIQISNGANPVDFRAITLNTPSNPPNYFQTKQIFTSNQMSKENASSISSGRGGCVFTDDYQFYFSIGDVYVNGNAVKFVDLADSVSVKSANTLNKYLVTEPFTINDNTKLGYSAMFGVIDSAAAFKALKTGDAVKYKVELIGDKTGSVISSFDNLTFSKDKITKRGYKTYSVSAKGLGNKSVRLRLVTESSINADYAINNIYATGSVLKKSAAEELEIKNAPVVKEYALEQNYPNPFNPSTVINYQIPNANKVSLKVYDVLGKEIVTLVDGYKEAGRYQVTFDCGKLASGVYIYKLESGKFVQSRKMILTK